jgi:hypothetical protein
MTLVYNLSIMALLYIVSAVNLNTAVAYGTSIIVAIFIP